MKPRFLVETVTGRTFFVYADSLSHAEKKVIEGMKLDPLAIRPERTRPAGEWNPARSVIENDPTEVTVEGDVHARPPSKPKPLTEKKTLNGSALNGSAGHAKGTRT